MNPVKMENRETIRCCWILFDTGRKYITHGWWYVLRFSLPLTSPPLLTHPFHFGVVRSLVPVCCALSSTFLTKSHCADYTRLRVRMQGGIRISVRLSFPYRMNSNRHGEDNTRRVWRATPMMAFQKPMADLGNYTAVRPTLLSSPKALPPAA